MKTKTFIATLFAVMITSYAFSQWGSNIPDIYNNNSGKLGISPTGNFTNPSYQIDCKGDINLNGSTNILRLGGNKFLWNNGNSTDLFVGVNAGNAGITGGHANTLIGYSAGNAITSANNNTAVGYQALNSNTVQHWNTAIGYQSLFSLNSTTVCPTCSTNVTGNTAVGYQTLYNCQAYGCCAFGDQTAQLSTTGCSVTAFGEAAMRYNTTGDDNVAIGASTCGGNETGTKNTCVGDQAGTGVPHNSFSYNTFLGAASGYSVTTGSDNAFMGYQSGFSLTTGAQNVLLGESVGYYNQTGSYNTIAGFEAGKGVTGNSHSNNSFFGYQAGKGITTGGNNVFMGYLSGNTNTTGQRNSYLGSYAGYSNSTGNYNVYSGYSAGYYTTGSYNVSIGDVSGSASSATFSNSTFVGQQAGHLTTTGGSNCFLGYGTGYNNTTGGNNVALGLSAGANFSAENSCTFIGNLADANVNNLTNATAIGNGAYALASNKAYIGNANLLSVNIVAGATYSGSDGRFKIHVTENVKGLEFIKKLRPVTYNMDTKALDNFIIQNMPDSAKLLHQKGMDFTQSTAVVHSGFIAQEVEQAAQSVNFTSSIVSTPFNSNDMYSLSYSEMVVPLVKAVQEQQKMIDSLFTIINAGKSQRTTGANTVPSTDVELASKSAILYQNMPNPFGDGTVVKYFVPENSIGASIIFFDEFGNEIKNMELPNKGATAELNLATMNLATGIYSYSMLVNGKVVDTKKMIKSK